jgi:perosamine synthetase
MPSVVETLAVDGGTPVRAELLPYGRQCIGEDDVEAVVDVLRSAWLTTGPTVGQFEASFARAVAAREAVAISNGTAALHAAMFALNVKAGDEIIVPALTFAATANCVIYQGGTPVFADVDDYSLLIDPVSIEQHLTPRSKAIIAVDYTGQPCDYDALRALADRHGLALIADACHALGGTYKGRAVGSLADLSTFSFHPVKHITTGEGGMISTDNPELAQRMRMFRNHGITSDHRQREQAGSWFYEMVELGYNYRLPDFQCVLGMSQLEKLSDWVSRRRLIAKRYDKAFSQTPEIQTPGVFADREPAWHLYVIQLNLDSLRVGRSEIFKALRAENIGVNVHYIPVPWHPYYQQRGYKKGQWPVAESAYERMITLPMFPAMADEDVDDVIHAVGKVMQHYAV